MKSTLTVSLGLLVGAACNPRERVALPVASVVAPSALPEIEQPANDNSNDPVLFSAPPPSQEDSIRVGEVIQGVLQQGDTVLPERHGRLADEYTIELAAGAPVTIVTRGGPAERSSRRLLDVVTALVCNGEEVVRDDDGAGYPNSRIVYTAHGAASCVIRVMGFQGDSGAYTLQVYPGALPDQT